MLGRFISLEGTEGCGKSTQLKLLLDWLGKKGKPLLHLREPGGTPLGESIRNLLQHDKVGHGMSPETELLLFAASRAELVRKNIKPALDSGIWVVCDRFLDSTTVYQGMARQLDRAAVEAVNRFAVGGVMPHLTLVLDLDVEEAQRRMHKRFSPKGSQADRLEREPVAFHRTVTEGYRLLAKKYPERLRLIPAGPDPGEVFQTIQKELRHAFRGELD
jgi:dTMP kinase